MPSKKHNRYHQLKITAAAVMAVGIGSTVSSGKQAEPGSHSNSAASIVMLRNLTIPSAAQSQESELARLTPDQLQTTLSDQLKKNGVELPEVFAADGRQRGFFGAMERGSEAANNFIYGLFGMHDNTEGLMNASGVETIIGVSEDGDVRKGLSKGIYAGDCKNYLDTHFKEFQLAVAVHETSHYVDHKLGLSQGIFDRTLKSIDKSKVNPDLIAGTADRSLLGINIKERIADASQALYVLSNYGNSDISKAVMSWRDANMEERHYSASTTRAAIDAFQKNPRRDMDVVQTTKMAADVVNGRMDDILKEQQTVEAINAAKQRKQVIGFPGVDESAKGEVISAAQRGRDELCGRPRSFPAKPALNL